MSLFDERVDAAKDVRDLITEARKCAPGDDPTGLAVMVHRLADALASRAVQGEPNDDELASVEYLEGAGHAN